MSNYRAKALITLFDVFLFSWLRGILIVNSVMLLGLSLKKKKKKKKNF